MLVPRLFIPVLLTLTLGCRPRDHEASKVDALPQARAILGPAHTWPPLELDAITLNESMTARRSAGWATVARALQRVPVIDPSTGEPMRDSRGEVMSLPMWQTWYELNEFRKMMEDLWAQLTPEQKQQRRSDPELVDNIMRKHHQRKLLSKWTRPDPEGKTRFQRLLSQIRSPEELSALNGVSGQGYTLHSPEVIRHYLLHFGEAVACQGQPPTHATENNDADLATCFGGKPFPKGAASVKATWNNGNDGIAAFDTSAAGLSRMLSQSEPTWRPQRSEPLHYPNAESIYSSYVFEDDRPGPTFRLTGLHITTKDIPEWLWVSLWWAPNPDEDFGEDRPTSLAEQGLSLIHI